MKAVTVIAFVLLLSTLLFSCNWFQEKEFVLVQVTNNTMEPVSVETGLTLISVVVGSHTEESVQIVKGVTVQATGKDTGFDYGSRTFYSDGTWTIP